MAEDEPPAGPGPAPARPIQEDRGRAFFDKHVDAMLAVLTGQSGGQTFRADLQKRAAELYAKYESPDRSYAESWILAIRDVLLEDGVLSENAVDARLKELHRALDGESGPPVQR